MINHARSLLANVLPSAAADGHYLAEELIDPSFLPLSNLPDYIVSTRQRLFGPAPDRNMINYRCRQLLSLAHATELAGYITALDRRITYATGEDSALLAESVFSPSYVQLTGPSAALSFYGAPAPPEITGKVTTTYTLTVMSDTTVRVDGPDDMVTISEVALVDGLTPGVPLRGTNRSVCLTALAVGASWLITVVERPQWGPGQLAVGLALLGGDVFLSLFGPIPQGPYQTFSALWASQREVPLRLSAVVLALIYRLEELRRG